LTYDALKAYMDFEELRSDIVRMPAVAHGLHDARAIITTEKPLRTLYDVSMSETAFIFLA